MAEKPNSGSLPDAISSGDLRTQLIALRDLLTERIAAAEPKETAPLARQLADVLVRIAGLPGDEKSGLDDLAAKRAKRRAQVQNKSASG